MPFKNILPKALSLFLAAILQFSALVSNCANANPILKITDLKFDNSDAVVFLKSEGNINLPQITSAPTETEGEQATPEDNPYNSITKGFLKDPARAYVDITNAVLSGPSKNYELKNSVLKNVKISQFSLNPNIVRVVFTYKAEDVSQANFNVIANNKLILIRYSAPISSTIVKTQKSQIIYSNTDDSNRVVFFENTTSAPADSSIVPVSNNSQNNLEQLNKMFEKNNENTLNISNSNYKLQSKFYISGIQSVQNGVMVKGTGFLSLKPAFFLENPSRMVIDVDDAVLAPNLRNKAININSETGDILKLGQNSLSVARIVIQSKDAKSYRAVISPDLQNIFIAKRGEVINSKITETESVLSSITENTANTSNFNFTNPVAFSVFEENNNLYLDFNNTSAMTDGVYDKLLKLYPEASTVKIALDKLRIILPKYDPSTNVQVKVSPDAKSIQVTMKTQNKTNEKPDEIDKKDGLISKMINKEPSISNLYKVVIDAGHGGSDVGATRAGIYEKNITLAIAKMIEKNLKDKGVQTTMTLEKDKTVSLQERCDISNETKPDVFLSVHVNSSVNDAIYGVETHWWKEDSKAYASIVHARLAKNFNKWNTKDRGLFKSQFYVINHTEAPAILVEIGFISNEDEREAISKQKRQSEIAKAISEGVMEYLKNKGKTK